MQHEHAPTSISSSSPIRGDTVKGGFQLGFDNRTGLTSEHLVTAVRRVKARVRGNPSPLGGCRPHFWFEFAGRRFAYAYVPKNACTSFKNFIVSTSKFKTSDLPQHEKIKFLLTHHRISGVADIRSTDFTLFVYRDPVERFLSVFKNKFIVQRGDNKLTGRDLSAFDNVRRTAGCDPASMSAHGLLIDFLAKHLSRRNARLSPTVDHHFLPQRYCIGTLNYRIAIDIANLHARMADLVGEEAAERYFKRPENATRDPTFDDNVSEVPSCELHQCYLSTGRLPSNRALITPAMEETIRKLYRVDFDMINSISRRSNSN
jgi:hypothetical protein